MAYDDPGPWPESPAKLHQTTLTKKTDLEQLESVAMEELGLSEVDLILLPRRTNFALDVLKGCSVSFPTQVGTIISTVLFGLSALASVAIGFPELLVGVGAYWCTMMVMLWSSPVENSWWRAVEKQIIANEADFIRSAEKFRNERRLLNISNKEFE